MGRHSLPKRGRLLPTQRRPEFGLDEQFVADIRLWRDDAPTVPFPVITDEDRREIGLDIFFDRTQDAADRYRETPA